MTLDIFDVIQPWGQGVIDVDHNDFPVGFFLVEQSHHAEHLDLLNLTSTSHKLTYFADVKRVVISLGFGLRMDGVGVFPGLSLDF